MAAMVQDKWVDVKILVMSMVQNVPTADTNHCHGAK
jgi:hypothetical protein